VIAAGVRVAPAAADGVRGGQDQLLPAARDRQLVIYRAADAASQGVLDVIAREAAAGRPTLRAI
jgi:hypothetical protein